MNSLIDALTECTMNVKYDNTYNALMHDMRVIISTYERECNDEVDPSVFKLRPGVYKFSQNMYRDIVNCIGEIGYGDELLELMPYIDDYIMLFFM
jgi:hypothetical protein